MKSVNISLGDVAIAVFQGLSDQLFRDATSCADRREIADGLLTAAILSWLTAHEPCGEPGCVSCAQFDTEAARTAVFLRFAESIARRRAEVIASLPKIPSRRPVNLN